uniref:Uncharacterized protein n=1 Tax=Oryza sativa subsp. japonica TaxID=39947 RepID=Q69XP1_ORYSJ|nr:hypothetical protein [Oryza sativa Japonica Group]
MGEDGWSGGSLGTASRMSKGRKDNDGGGDSVSAGQFPPRRLHPHLPPAAAVFVFCSFLTLDGSLIRVASSSSASPPLLTSNSPSLCPYGDKGGHSGDEGAAETRQAMAAPDRNVLLCTGDHACRTILPCPGCSPPATVRGEGRRDEVS